MKRFLKSIWIAMAAALSMNVSAQQMSLQGNASWVEAGTPVFIDYDGTAKGDKIMLYHNLSIIPLKLSCNIKGNAGTFEVGAELQPGSYRAVLLGKDEEEKNTLSFTVGDYPLPTEGKRVFVMSDIHVMSPFLVEDPTSFYYLNYMSQERKLIPESYEIFCACIDSIKAMKPDLVIIPGDLTKDGERDSHLMVVSKLYELLDKDIPTLVIPGNHDMENIMSWTFTTDGHQEAPTIMPDEFETIYASFGYANSINRDPYSLSYACEPFDGLVFLGIDDCKLPSRGDTERGATEYGRISQETLDWALEEADKAMEQKKVVIAAVHHQLLQHYNGQSSFMASAATEQGDSIARLFADHGIKVVLTGHMHIPNISRIPGFKTSNTLTEISSASTVTYPSQFKILTIADDLSTMNVNTRMLNRTEHADPLQAVARDKVESTLDNSISQLTSRYLSMFNKMLDDFSSDPIFAGVIQDVPTDPNEMAAIAKVAFGKTIRKVIFTTSEGNEHLKDAVNEVDKQIQADCKMACDMVFDHQNEDTRAFLAYSMYIYVMDTMEDMVKSMLGDTSHLGTAWADQTDDLYLTIPLKDAEAGVDECLAPVSDTGTIVYNMSGQVMGTSILSLPKGAYVVKKGNVIRKVLVR